MALSPQWLDELRARTSLSAVIQRTTRLQKAGREWKACCPFHDEKTPSFYVNDAKGFYHCFGCQAHGDVIRWMTDQRGLGFIDAVKELASEAGMELPAPDPQAAKKAERRLGLIDAMEAAQDWFVFNLAAPGGAETRAYLERRGIAPELAASFGFGLAPNERQAMPRALSDFPEPMLQEAGLRAANEDGEAYDRFRNRLTLPIHDARGRVIAFGGRILDPASKAPKYLNSPDTPLFDKGRNLYNLDRAAPAARKAGRMVVVEGYMDVVALAGAGVDEAVAPMGTALTAAQIELLWRHAEVPVLCFDGDAAGRRAALKAIGRALPLLKPGHSLAFVHLPQGQDPDDLIRAEGGQAMQRLLADPTTLLDALWQAERDGASLATPEDKAGLKARLIEATEAIAHPDIRSLYRRELLDRFSAFAYPPRKPWTPGGRPAPRPVASSTSRRSLPEASLATLVLAGFARWPGEIARHAERLAELSASRPEHAGAVEALFAAMDRLEHISAPPISDDEPPPLPPGAPRLAFLAKETDPVAARAELEEALALLVERPALDDALAAATARFDTDPGDAYAQQQALLKRKLALDARLGQMAGLRASRSASEPVDDVPEPAATN